MRITARRSVKRPRAVGVQIVASRRPFVMWRRRARPTGWVIDTSTVNMMFYPILVKVTRGSMVHIVFVIVIASRGPRSRLGGSPARRPDVKHGGGGGGGGGGVPTRMRTWIPNRSTTAIMTRWMNFIGRWDTMISIMSPHVRVDVKLASAIWVRALKC